jgi:hypothetical protein
LSKGYVIRKEAYERCLGKDIFLCHAYTVGILIHSEAVKAIMSQDVKPYKTIGEQLMKVMSKTKDSQKGAGKVM